MLKLCPVTHLEIISTTTKEKGAHWTYHKFDDDWKIGFSKYGDALPLTSFEVSDSAPCLDKENPFSWNNAAGGVGKEDFLQKNDFEYSPNGISYAEIPPK